MKSPLKGADLRGFVESEQLIDVATQIACAMIQSQNKVTIFGADTQPSLEET
jgi:hypothetical protein